MTAIRLLLAKLRALARSGRDNEDLAGELATHLDLIADDLERQGLPRPEARRQARLRLGGTGQIVGAARDQRGLPWIALLARDV